MKLWLWRFILIFLICALMGYGGWITYSHITLSNKNELTQKRLTDLEQVREKLQEETRRLVRDKEMLVEENEGLSSQALSYLKLQRTQRETWEEASKDFSEQLEQKSRQIKEVTDELKKAKDDLAKVEKEIEEQTRLTIEVKDEAQERVRKVKEELSAAEGELKGQEALRHYNLGFAYTSTGNYSAAVDEYKKTLDFDPDNAEAHYNLGIIYDDCYQDSQKAIEHYQRYLELRPEADDIYEVENWIERLGSRLRVERKIAPTPKAKAGEEGPRKERLTKFEGRFGKAVRLEGELKAKLEEESEKVAQLSDTKGALEARLEWFERSLDQKEETIAIYKKEIDGAKAQLKKATGILMKKVAKLIRAREGKGAELKERLDQAKNELDQTRSELNHASRKLSEMEEELASLKVELEDAVSQRDSLKEKLNEH